MAGVISSKIGATGNTHYVAYCHNIRTARWTKHDNRFRKLYPTNERNSVSVALIFYINCTLDSDEKNNSSLSLLTKNDSFSQSKFNSPLSSPAKSFLLCPSESNLSVSLTKENEPVFPSMKNISFSSPTKNASLYLSMKNAAPFLPTKNASVSPSSPFNSAEFTSSDILFTSAEFAKSSYIENSYKHNDHTYSSLSSNPRQLLLSMNSNVCLSTAVSEQENSRKMLKGESDTVNFPLNFKLIKNGKLLKPKCFKNIMYKYEEASKFDSMMEIFVRARANFQAFKEFCFTNKDKNETGFLKAIISYGNEGNVRFLYNYRWTILLEKKFESLKDGNVLFSKDLIGSYCSRLMSIEKLCKKCNKN